MFFTLLPLTGCKKIPTKTFAQQKCAIINCDVMNFPISIGEIVLVHLNIFVY